MCKRKSTFMVQKKRVKFSWLFSSSTNMGFQGICFTIQIPKTRYNPIMSSFWPSKARARKFWNAEWMRFLTALCIRFVIRVSTETLIRTAFWVNGYAGHNACCQHSSCQSSSNPGNSGEYGLSFIFAYENRAIRRIFCAPGTGRCTKEGSLLLLSMAQFTGRYIRSQSAINKSS